MNLRVISPLIALLVAACQPQSISQSAPTPAAARFEIRDFKLTEVTTEYGSLNVSGRGTLVALDDSMKKGNYLLWFTGKRSRKEEDIVSAALIMKNGLATLETSDYVSKDDKDKVKVRYSDWKMTGYVKLSDGVFVAEGAASAPQK